MTTPTLPPIGTFITTAGNHAIVLAYGKAGDPTHWGDALTLNIRTRPGDICNFDSPGHTCERLEGKECTRPYHQQPAPRKYVTTHNFGTVRGLDNKPKLSQRSMLIAIVFASTEYAYDADGASVSVGVWVVKAVTWITLRNYTSGKVANRWQQDLDTDTENYRRRIRRNFTPPSVAIAQERVRNSAKAVVSTASVMFQETYGSTITCHSITDDKKTRAQVRAALAESAGIYMRQTNGKVFSVLLSFAKQKSDPRLAAEYEEAENSFLAAVTEGTRTTEADADKAADAVIPIAHFSQNNLITWETP